MAVTPEQFASIVSIIEDGELDDHMPALIEAINDRNERRKGDILRLVRSIYGQDAQITGGGKSPMVAPVAPQTAPEAPQALPEVSGAVQVPPGHYLAADGSVQPMEEPAPKAKVEYDPEAAKARAQLAQQQAAAQDADLGQRSVRDTFGGKDPYGDNNPDIVSTGAQIIRHQGEVIRYTGN